MFCEKCGSQLLDSDKFCPKCGAPVSTEKNSGSSEGTKQDAQAPAHGTEPTGQLEPAGQGAADKASGLAAAKELAKAGLEGAKKLTGNSKAVYAIIAVAAVLLLVIIVNFASINNMIRSAISSPEKYYQYVEKKNAEELSSVMGDIYRLYVLDATDTSGRTYNTSLSLELGESGQELLQLAGLAGVDLSWFNSATLNAGLTVKDDKIGMELSALANKDNILSFVMAMDIMGGEAFFQIPEATNTYIGLDLKKVMGSSQLRNMQNQWEEMMESLEESHGALPSKAKLEKQLKKYMGIALDCVEDVNKKSRTLKVEGVDQNCILLNVTIDVDTLEDIFEAILEEAEDDGDLEELFIDLGDAIGVDGRDAYDELLEDLEYYTDNMRRYYGNFEIEMSVYVDGKGKVVGREIKLGDATVSMLMPQKGSKFGYEFSIEDRRDTLSLTGSGKRSGDKIDGDFRLRYNGTPILDITTDDLDLKSLKRGQLNGDLEIGMGSGIGTVLGYRGLSIVQDMRFGLAAKTSDDSFRYRLSIVDDDEDMGAVTVSAERKNASSVKIPSDRNVVFVEDERDFEEWADSIDWDKLISNLEKTDLPRSVTRTIEKIGNAMEKGRLDDVEDILDDALWYWY